MHFVNYGKKNVLLFDIKPSADGFKINVSQLTSANTTTLKRWKYGLQ